VSFTLTFPFKLIIINRLQDEKLRVKWCLRVLLRAYSGELFMPVGVTRTVRISSMRCGMVIPRNVGPAAECENAVADCSGNDGEKNKAIFVVARVLIVRLWIVIKGKGPRLKPLFF
jgi:hypothetical protein